jgi:hypothetical protein
MYGNDDLEGESGRIRPIHLDFLRLADDHLRTVRSDVAEKSSEAFLEKMKSTIPILFWFQSFLFLLSLHQLKLPSFG